MTTSSSHQDGASRRGVVASGLGLAVVAALPSLAPTPSSAATPQTPPKTAGDTKMSSGFITTKDGTQIFYKDWGPKTPSRSCSITAGR
jgi:non-heme chloroperoxidase